MPKEEKNKKEEKIEKNQEIKKDKKDKKVDKKSADVDLEKKDLKKDKETKKEDIEPEVDSDNYELDLDDIVDTKYSSDELEQEELPDDIKKKLEKQKIERARVKHAKKKKRKKAEKRNVKVGKAYIKATYNNTIVTLTDLQGNTLSTASAGLAGFKGPKKSTPYAAQIITRIACIKAKEEYGLEEVAVFVRGIGSGRESAIRSLNINKLNITSIRDITPIPHNGCRARRPRRI